MSNRIVRLVVGIGLIIASALCAPLEAQQSTPSAIPPAAPAPTAQQPAAPAQPPAAAAPAPVPAPAPVVTLPAEVLEPIQRLSKNIETAEKSIQQLKELETELSSLRTEVERIIYDSTAAAEQLRPQLAEVKGQIEKLGPPPAKDQPAESETVAAERARLNALAGALDGAVKTTELAWVRAKQLIDRITVIRYQLFTRNLFERRDSPMLPSVWRDVGSRIDGVAGRFMYYGKDWLRWVERKAPQVYALLALALALGIGGSVAVRSMIASRLVRPEPPPSFFQRVAKASWVAPLRMLPPALALLSLYFGFEELELLFSPWEATALAILKGGLIYIAASALISVSLAPQHPAWRLIPLADHTTARVAILLKAFVGLYMVDTVLVEICRAIYTPLTITVVQAFIISLLFAALLALLLLTPFSQQIGADRPVNGHVHVERAVTRLEPAWLKLPLWAIALTISGAALLGYISLSRFIAHQIVLSGMVVAIGLLLYLAIRATTRGRSDDKDVLGNLLGTHLGLEPSKRRQISRLTELFLTLGLIVLVMPALLLQWGSSEAEIRAWLTALLFGFEVGHFKISLFRILIGIALFIGLLFLTRMIQRWLRDQVMSQARMDAGIANSVDTAVGYAGTALALLLALSYAGLDITNLAIVAGALSVGIGFGLQSIVNNFVSGLILLVERPIKVGDWIVVGSEQGNVRRISVRATEIETFDRSSLIIPNSELIMGRVLNWTHRNMLGRAVIKITVEPNADPDRIIEILKECAAAHPDVLPGNPPVVTFDNFSSSGLEFTIRATVADVYKSGSVNTQVRASVLKRLRAEGIVNPNPAYDIHLRDLDFVRALVQRVAEQRAAEAAHVAPAPPAGEPTKG